MITAQQQKEREQAVKFYRAISEGKVKGAKIRPTRIFKGTITFIDEGAIVLKLE